MNTKRTLLVVLSAVLVLALGVGAVALVSTSGASAEDGPTHPEGEFVPWGGRGSHGLGGKLGRGGQMDGSYLAEALGISVEELQAAQQEAHEAAIEQALDQGLITEEQAEAMKENDRGFFGKGFKRGGFGPEGAAQGEGIDFEALLADALGITVEKLQAAREQAADSAMQAAIESGNLTEEQVELIEARKALMGYMDKDTMSEALGITLEDLQAAREAGKSPKDLMEEKGLTIEDIQAAMQAAFEDAVKSALEDGAITQDQADLLLEAGFGHGSRGGFPGFGGRGRPGMGGPGGFERPFKGPNPAAPESDV